MALGLFCLSHLSSISDAVSFQIQFLSNMKGQRLHMLHAIKNNTISDQETFFSFRQCSVPAAKKLVSFLFDCQNLFAANKLIRLQRTRSGDRGINDAAKSTCSETTRHL